MLKNKHPSGNSWEEMVAAIRPGSSGNEVAVHKPLLILILLARAQQGGSNEVPFNEIDALLEEGIRRFGSAKSPGGSELPFWHLKNDGFWAVEDEDEIPRRKQGDRPTKSALRKWGAKGHVPLALWQELVNTPELLENLARYLLEQFWPASSHAAILKHVHFRLSTGGKPSAE